jgi:hypothetical protein
VSGSFNRLDLIGTTQPEKELRIIEDRLAILTSSTKRLIDGFLYTQYSRQMQGDSASSLIASKRLADSVSCSHGCFSPNSGNAVWNSRMPEKSWRKAYCDHRRITREILKSLRDDHPGLGAG